MKAFLTGINHLGLPVTQIERSRAFYAALGFEHAMTAELPVADGTTRVCMMTLGSFVLELYQLPGAEGAEIAGRADGHIDHVALDVTDIGAAFAAARAMHLDLLQDAPVALPFWEKGIRYFIVRGPDGEKVEFCQRLKA